MISYTTTYVGVKILEESRNNEVVIEMIFEYDFTWGFDVVGGGLFNTIYSAFVWQVKSLLRSGIR